MAGRTDLRMTDAEVQQALAVPGQRMVVATLLPDGLPHLTVVWYGFTEDRRLGFTVPAGSQKVKNLTRDPRVTVLVDAGTQHGELRGVQIAGRAVLAHDLPTKLTIHASVAARYPTKPSPDPERTMARRVAVIVEPISVVSWDHRKLATR
ncbi:pyridoxamine 5'-phosphate oxidase family protein [Streptosporangium sp. CA-115845]|uniref:pyridoxamine 5'-phosphate oxidase family protein n=1 Tax=Streptosporangium sp. CA-115845 TaxID=3240071 RepID=UPI003D9441A2